MAIYARAVYARVIVEGGKGWSKKVWGSNGERVRAFIGFDKFFSFFLSLAERKPRGTVLEQWKGVEFAPFLTRQYVVRVHWCRGGGNKKFKKLKSCDLFYLPADDIFHTVSAICLSSFRFFFFFLFFFAFSSLFNIIPFVMITLL